MPKRNYQFEKRQKDLEKKRKAELKAQRKLDRAREPEAGEPGIGDDDADAPDPADEAPAQP